MSKILSSFMIVFGSSSFYENLFFQVVILNATSVALEVRFDIPFGLSPKVT